MANNTEESVKPADPAAKDRRADRRFKFTAAATVTDKTTGNKIESRVSDLGRLGCFFDTDKPLALGTMVLVSITKGPKTFQTIGRVVFSAVGKGMGLFFTDIDPEQREILSDWLAASLETSWLASTRRRSQRILLRVSVRILGQNSFGTPFEEETYTQAASAHGALLLLSATVKKGQRLTMSNVRTQASTECIVAHIGDVQGQHTQVGVAFMLPNPGFWNATFPPEDWSARHPDAKSKSAPPVKRDE